MKYIIDVPNQDYSYNEILHMLKLKFYDDNLSCEVALDAEQYTETDGCDGCKYVDTEELEEPCRRCKNSYKLMWRAKE